MKRIVLVNPNTSAATTALMVSIARAHLAAGFAMDGATAATGAPLIVDEDQLRIAADAVARMAPSLAGTAEGVIVAAFGDPGVEALGAALSVPVAGIAACAMGEAAAAGRRFAVVTTTPALVAAIAARAENLGFGRQLAGVRTTEGPPQALMADRPRLVAALERAARRAIAEDAAEAIIIGGGPLAAVAQELRSRLPCPVIEPIPAAVRWMNARLGAGSLREDR
jgi:Asp/Glu/hydantoin racemase